MNVKASTVALGLACAILALSGCRQEKLTQQQERFLAAMERGAEEYFVKTGNALNDRQTREAARPRRKQAVCELFGGAAAVSGWVGTVVSIRGTSDYVLLELNVARFRSDRVVKVRSTQEAVIRSFARDSNEARKPAIAEAWASAVPASSEIYATLRQLKEGDKVVFGGEFFRHEADCFREVSITEGGAMSEPEFLFRFTSVRPVG